MPKKYKLHHGEVTFEYAEIHGYCELPNRLCPSEDFGIVIDSRTRGKQLLIDIIHEVLHAEHPDKSEEWVQRTADNVGKVVWGEGYRRKA